MNITPAERDDLLGLLSGAQALLEALVKKTPQKPVAKLRIRKRLDDLADRVNTIRVEIYDLTDGDLG